jgi:hypothetical protein
MNTSKHKFHDLDYLAGTWSEEEYKNFEEFIKCFRKIDPELWGEASLTWHRRLLQLFSSFKL